MTLLDNITINQIMELEFRDDRGFHDFDRRKTSSGDIEFFLIDKEDNYIPIFTIRYLTDSDFVIDYHTQTYDYEQGMIDITISTPPIPAGRENYYNQMLGYILRHYNYPHPGYLEFIRNNN